MADLTFPVTFVKGDRAVTVHNARQAVSARFNGYLPLDEAAPPASAPDRALLQERAKELGIPANQSNAVLAAAVLKADARPNPPVAVEHPAADGAPGSSPARPEQAGPKDPKDK